MQQESGQTSRLTIDSEVKYDEQGVEWNIVTRSNIWVSKGRKRGDSFIWW